VLQLGQIVERVDLIQLAGVDQAHVVVTGRFKTSHSSALQNQPTDKSMMLSQS
jgi:hypothetical protein